MKKEIKINKRSINVKEKIRVIQYLGSKVNILDAIEKEIKKITPEHGTVVDLFSGTGVVSSYLADSYRVIANDVQEYSSLITGVLIKNSRSLIGYDDLINSEAYKNNKDELCKYFKDILEYEQQVIENNDTELLAKLCECNVFYNGENISDTSRDELKKIFGESINMFTDESIEKFKNDRDIYALFTLYYSNSYFSVEQCIEIDSIRKAIDMIETNSTENSVTKKILMVCLLHAVSEIVSSVGKNFAQPIKVVDGSGKIKTFAINRCMRDRKLKIEDPFKEMLEILNRRRKIYSDSNKAYTLDSFEAIEITEIKAADTFYLDPPYTIDHYSRFYHVLETLVKYDYPILEEKKYNGKIYLMNGRYRNDRFQSNYCIPSKGKMEFEKLIETISSTGANIIMSYSDSDDNQDTRKRVVSKVELMELLKKNYPNVKMRNISHRYRKLSSKNSNRKELDDGELLFICHY